MKYKKISRPPVAADDRECGTGVSHSAISSNAPRPEYNIDSRRVQGRIESMLRVGAENATTTKHLLEVTGFSCAADLQKQIERERHNGAMILSKCKDGGGYFLPASRQEIADFERTLRRRALSTLRTLHAARQALKTVDGQIEIGGGADGEA